MRYALAWVLGLGILFHGAAGFAWNGSFDLETPLQYTIHITNKGDTLCDIAASPMVYGSCLKWPQIYYYNVSEIKGSIPHNKDLPFTPLPAGLGIAIIHPKTVEDRSQKITKDFDAFWAINVMSRDQSRELAELALKLMDEGHYCYITKFTTEDTVWKRLRVGFFPNLEIARQNQEELKEKLGLHDAWVNKATPEEVLEFVGYLE